MSRSRTVLALLFLVVLACPAFGQAMRSDVDLSTPRATMETFISALNPPDGGPMRPDIAVMCLDLSALDEVSRNEANVVQGLALKLKEIIDHTRRVVYDDIPPPGPDTEIYIFDRFPAGPIVIRRQEDGNWLFDTETVKSIDAILPQARLRPRQAGRSVVPFTISPSLWLRSLMPEPLLKTGFLLEHWQWLGLLALCILGIVVERIVSAIIPAWLRGRLRRRRLDVDERTAKVGLRPFGVLAMALVWWALLDWLGLPVIVHRVLVVAVRFLAAAAGVWAAYRLVDVFTEMLARKAASTKTRFDDLLVPLFRKSLKVFITVVGIVFLASVLHINVTSLLAGLGLGGLAFALAAQDTVKNLFGSLTVIFDRPFHVGDWVRIGDQEGTVEEVGFRSTRVRTFYNSVITIPNGNLISAVTDNMGARRYRRVKTVLSLTYDTPPEKIDAFCEGVRELIRRHPYTRKDYYHVYFNQFAGSSLDVLLYAFFEVPDWAVELRERHRLFNDILRLSQRLGVEFAFPTQTLFVNPEAPSGEPPAYPTEDGVTEAEALGRREAREIVTGTLGDPVRKPPPVTFGLSEREMRGDEDDGGDGGDGGE
jgi:MscS family membrane protein